MTVHTSRGSSTRTQVASLFTSSDNPSRTRLTIFKPSILSPSSCSRYITLVGNRDSRRELMVKTASQESGGLYSMSWDSTSKWISSHRALTNLGCNLEFSEITFQNDSSSRRRQTNHHYRQYRDLWLPSFSSSHAVLFAFMDAGTQKSGWH